MKNSVKRLLALLLTLAMALSVFASCDKSDVQNDPDSSENGDGDSNGGKDDEISKIPMGSKVGQRAITKELELISGEGTVNISQFKGKVVVLNFWGTWCVPCKSELPDFNEIASEYSDSVAVVAVHTAFDAAAKAVAPDYVEQNFPNSKIYFAFDKAIGTYDDEYYTLLNGDGSYPTTFVIDERGVITKVKVGMMSYNELKNYIDAALAD